MNKIRLTVLCAAAAMVACTTSLPAAIVYANYTFTGIANNNTGPWASASTTDPNSSVGNLSNTGLTGGMGTYVDTSTGNPSPSLYLDMGAISQNSLANAVSHNTYLSFTITGTSSGSLNLNGSTFALDSVASGTGSSWGLEYALNGGATYTQLGSSQTIGTGSFANQSISLSSGFDGLNSITFRVYVWQTSEQNVNFDNIEVQNLSAVPEANALWPALAVLGLVVAGGAWRSRRVQVQAA